MFDINGDGKPDVLGTDGTVYELVSDARVGAPQAGRLVQIENGFGATTVITYSSTKLLASSGAVNTLHQVPFPEVVVTSVQTTVPSHPELNLAPTRYAYGGAQQVFDPIADRFAFRGYRRQVALRSPSSEDGGIAAITDLYQPVNATDPYDLGSAPLTDAQRYARYLRMGRVSDISVLQVDTGTDPSALLSADVATDPRRIGNTHYEYDARSLTVSSDPPGPEPCSEMVYPYDYAASQAFSSVDACRARGLGFATSVEASRGEPGAALRSAATVTTRTEVRSVDDFGRPLTIANLGDFARTDDDLCVTTTFAAPTGSDERVLSAVASRTVTDCVTDTVYSNESFEYDTLPVGGVSSGFLTSHNIERRDDTGNLLATIREFDTTYDAAGNPHTMTTSRKDGASRTATVDYDPFGLVPVRVTSAASNVPTMMISLARDPLTLLVTDTTDPNGTQRGTQFDGFDRPTMSTVTPPAGAIGALSVTSYQGFTDGDTSGRRITGKVFTDAVDPNTVNTAIGRAATVHIDELGRESFSEIVLGADYPGQTIIAGARTYDSFGRVLFQADPYPSSQDGATAYGTTRHFNTDGTLSCTVRGNGPQPFTTVTDGAHETFPTCLVHTFADHQVKVLVKDAAALVADQSSAQYDVANGSDYTAIGRLVDRRTWKGGTPLEYATFCYDRLGRLTSMTRYQDPTGSGGNPVTSQWHFDSLRQLLELDEPDAVPQLYTYSSWGELLETDRTVSGTLKSVVQKYDARSRLVHGEHQDGGVIDPESVHDYSYDQPVDVAPQVTTTNVLGKLSQATSPTGAVIFGYDDLGRTNLRVFTDPQSGIYLEKHTLHADGSLQALDLFLPDTGFLDEHVEYGYDSAGRTTAITYQAPSGVQQLFLASAIDTLGRVRGAHYGAANYTASYADVGRRLLTQVSVSSRFASRSISFQGFDPVGRERGRTEVKNDDTANAAMTTWAYDELGRLASAVQTRGTSAVFNQQFTYDPLGNLLSATDTATSGASTTTMTYATTDRDRICGIAYGPDGATACNVTYDELGSILSQPTATGNRQYSYLVDGSVRTINDDHGTAAHFRYDAFGGVKELELTSSVSADTRHDRHYGSLFTWHDEPGRGRVTQVLLRTIPGPDGFIATRHGFRGNWVFSFGEPRGTRFTVDRTGAFVQDIDYQPFGKPTSTGDPPAGSLYSNQQWNGGDALVAFGISQLGARLYDPAIGRFISRDPLLIPRTAGTTNPYAFADNDPVNGSDPSGLINTDTPGKCGGDDNPCPTPTTNPGGGSDSTGAPTGPPDAISGGGMDGCAICNIYYFGDDGGGGYAQPSSPEGSLVPMPGGIWGGGGGGTVSSDGRYLFGQVSSYPVWPSAPQFKGPSAYDRLRDYYVDGITEILSDVYADTVNGVYDTVGGVHPGHATVVEDVRPGIRSVVGVGFDIAVQLVLAVALGELQVWTSGARTRGILYTGKAEFELASGSAGGPPALPFPGRNNTNFFHVEAHAAEIMRLENLTEATLKINRVPCTVGPGCANNLQHMLPEGARLRVLGPDGYDQTFVGLPDPPNYPR